MFLTVTTSLVKGLGTAMELFGLTLLFALPLGLVIAFGSMSKWQPFKFLQYGQENPGSFVRFFADLRPISALTNVIVWIIRGTPLMLQLIIIFYGPGLWFDNNIWSFSNGRMAACVVAFVINYSCYFSVIYRGGIEGVPQGQREAGEVLGMTKSQIFFKITLLQMIKRIVPPMSNEIITLVKDTSLARIIAITELIKAGEAYMKSDGITWPLFYTAVYYLLFVGVLTILFNFIERKLSYFR
ncbi:MAG: amino acid ABC transporter permease [Oscillibacter sp.]|jgi:polar amino acid transport system permease protein|nr:amino acid ABC transporter permease [Oscillibacter sp.]